MSHTLLDGINFLRTSLLDDTGGTGIDWTTITEGDDENHQLRWSNEELTTFINESWKQVARRLLCYRSSDAFTLSVKTGVNKYVLDSKILKIISVESQQQKTQIKERDLLEIVDIRGWRDNEGYILAWCPEYDTQEVLVYPKPIQDDVFYLTVYHLPLIDLSWSKPDQKITIRDEWFLGMLNYAAGLAYLKDEANSLDEARSRMFMDKFEQEFSNTSAYAESRKSKTANRPVAYGGINPSLPWMQRPRHGGRWY
jgi:hypothetical protein